MSTVRKTYYVKFINYPFAITWILSTVEHATEGLITGLFWRHLHFRNANCLVTKHSLSSSKSVGVLPPRSHLRADPLAAFHYGSKMPSKHNWGIAVYSGCIFLSSPVQIPLKTINSVVHHTFRTCLWHAQYGTSELLLPAATADLSVRCMNKKKGKAFPLQAWTDPWGSRRLRLQNF